MIVFVHLLNDRSGSPRVLQSAISALAGMDRMQVLYIGSDGNGVLSGCGLPIRTYWYRRTRWRILTLVTYMASQVLLLTRLLLARDIDRKAVIYVNTLLPFGAALYGWLTGRTVTYHVHEISVSPAPLRWLLVGIAKLTSRLNIYVSDAHRAALPIANVPFRRIYNALDDDFAARAAASIYMPRRDGVFNVLMIASLRNYKGIPELLNLSVRLLKHADVRIHLVVNDDHAAIQQYFGSRPLPANFTVHSRTPAPAKFYMNASLLLNLSRVDECVETFGLTILEAMAFGVPVIVPPVGGPTELVTDGVEGFLVDSRDMAALEKKVLRFIVDKRLCVKMSAACRLRALTFSMDAFAKSVRDVLAEAAAR
jgi:glycosyltransferase involved in cell wall biosynthesis